MPARGLAAVAAGLLVLSTGCSGSGSGSGDGPVDASKPVTLTWWTGQATDGQKLLEKMAGEFHTAHPNVTIKVSSGAPSTDKLLEKLSAGFAGGDFPDISYAFGAWATRLNASGKAVDITGKVKRPDVKWADLPPAAQKTVTVKDKVIGFPALIDDIGLVYNKKIFDQAHLAYPTNDWTWEQFADAAKKLTDPAAKRFGTGWPVDGTEATIYPFWPLLWQNGGSVLNEKGTKTAFDSDAGLRSMRLLQRMAVTDKSVYLDQSGTKIPQLFNAGNVAMMLTGPWAGNDIRKAGVPFGVTYLPGQNGDHQSIAGPDFWALLDHKDANRKHWSFEFVKWLTDPAQDARWSKVAGSLPLRPSEEQTPEWKSRIAADPTLKVFSDNLRNCKNLRPAISSYPEVSQEAANALIQVLVKGADPKKALTDGAAKADVALDG